MKKIILLVVVLLVASLNFMSAQQEMTAVRPSNSTVTTKDGHQILPAAGDFALGIDAVPFLEYIGNMFNGNNGNSAPSFDGFQQRIYGKYFLSENCAVRAKLAFDFGTDISSHSVKLDDLDPLNPEATTVDYLYKNRNEINIAAGYEMRRGYRRLQGFWGGEVDLGFALNSTSYKYGNQMTAANQAPTTYDFDTEVEGNIAKRNLLKKDGLKMSAALVGFVGVEYFLLPKISLGGELNLGVRGNLQTLGSTKYQQFNALTNVVEEKTNRIGQGALDQNRFHFNTVVGGTLFLIYHF